MTCSPYDLRDYLFEELTPAQRADVRLHLKSCGPCAAELDALRLTQSTLLTVRDEEMPRRIGFVSDKVFEPSPLARWLSGFWTGAPSGSARIGFVSSIILAAAILIHAYTRVPPPPIVQIVHNSAQWPAEINQQIQIAVDAAVTKAVAEAEQSAQKRTNALLTAIEKKYQAEQRMIRADYQAALEVQKGHYGYNLVASSYNGSGQ